MDLWNSVLLGFSISLEPINLFYCFMGVLMGTLIGVLPGIGPVATISILLPATFKMSPISGIIMLAGIYYGAMYGGSTTSILVNIPGEAASVVTCLDGYQMARKGRAGPALGISAFGSFIAGTFAVVALTLLAPPLAEVALQLGPPEYFSLVILGFTLLAYLAHGSMIKALMMACIGLIMACIGLDFISGFERFTYGIATLEDGIGLVPVAMGVFGVGEVLINLEESIGKREIFKAKISNLLPSLKDWKDSLLPIIRGSVLGFFLGILPGGGAVIASFTSYAVEKRFSKHPEEFGQGAIAGVAGPEAANNAGAGGNFIPLMTLGIPANPVMALMMGALVIHGLQPGPLLLSQNPDIFWGVIVSMYVGNIMLLILNLPLIGIWIRVLRIPYPFLFPLILLFCLIGSYSISNNKFDVLIMALFGVIGYLLRKIRFEAAPMLLAMVLGPMLEDALRQSLIMSGGSFTIFLVRPFSLTFIGLAAILMAFPIIKWILGKKTRLAAELPKEDHT
ncbi:MAG: tripartite tricarboxylate transporter permease [Thermodesulfobacteriota bacterium]|nr:tripartite tricarboxylate transporter permease [Thermodesulfobacteriota bacterium]